MNAYELANQAKEISTTIEALEWVQKATFLLCQQADRIAELEKGGEVAGRFYWESVVDGHVMAVPSEGTPHYNKDDFPLYTAPRELSDEDRQKLLAIFLESFALGHRCGRVGDDVADRFNELGNEFKAILKKASEK